MTSTGKNRTGKLLASLLGVICLLCCQGLQAEEVEKGHIPAEHLQKTCKKLPWGIPVWDNEEAVEKMSEGTGILWVDTRPVELFSSGTVRDAVCIPYNQTGKDGNQLNRETLLSALKSKNMSPDGTTIAFFCQGPECHRSYNATLAAITQWGFSPDHVIWFRDGYPNLFAAVKADAKLKRKAKKYLCDNAVKQL